MNPPAGVTAAAAPAWPEDHQVLARDASGSAPVRLRLPPDPRELSVLVTNDGGEAIALPSNLEETSGTNTLVITLPVGGPYRLEVRTGDVVVAVADDILVGDIWVLAGQSNMFGIGEEPQPDLALVRMLSFDGSWKRMEGSLFRLWESESAIQFRVGRLMNGDPEAVDRLFEAIQADPEARARGPVGPGYFFAREMTAASGVPMGLLPCALGSTGLEMWRRAWRAPDGADWRPPNLYWNMVERARSAGPATGLLWYQGEAESGAPPEYSYRDNFADFLAELRADLDLPRLPVVMAQIARLERERLLAVHGVDVPAENEPGWTRVREAQRLAGETIDDVAVVATADLPLGDGIHLDVVAQERLGRRMARAAQLLSSATTVPRLVGIEARADGREVVVRFERLTPPLQVPPTSMFTFDPPGDNAVAGVALEGDSLILALQQPVGRGTSLAYGAGFDTPPGLVDANDMALPLFGPLPIAAS